MSAWMGGGVEGEGESQADSVLSMEPDVGLYLMILRSVPELRLRVWCSTNQAIRVPL